MHKILSWQNVYNIVYSQAVTHPSTNTTQCCLTSVIRRELVLSTWYGRRHVDNKDMSGWLKFSHVLSWLPLKENRWVQTFSQMTKTRLLLDHVVCMLHRKMDSFAQWRYSNQWSNREVLLLLVENYTQYPAISTWNTVVLGNFCRLFLEQFGGEVSLLDRLTKSRLVFSNGGHDWYL